MRSAFSIFAVRAVLILFGLACVGTEVVGTFEFLYQKHGHLNYLVFGGVIVTSLAAVLPIAAEYARRNRRYLLVLACWLAVPLTLAFVFTAAIQRTGTVMDTDEAGRRQLAERISIARAEIGEAEAQVAVDKATVDRNCKVWGPICDKAKTDQRTTEKKLSDARAVLKTSSVEIDDSMIRRLVAYLPFLTREQVSLYYPMLLPLSLAVLGSLCIAAGSGSRRRERIEVPAPRSPTIIDITPQPKAKPKVPNRSRPKLAAITQKPVGAALDFLHDGIQIEDGQQTEMADAYIGYLSWCKAKQLSPLEVTDFADDIEKLCREVGIPISAEGNYLLNVRVRSDRKADR